MFISIGFYQYINEDASSIKSGFNQSMLSGGIRDMGSKQRSASKTILQLEKKKSVKPVELIEETGISYDDEVCFTA
jgi:hypothetical protein